MTDVGFYRPDDAAFILRTVRQLQASGLLQMSGRRSEVQFTQTTWVYVSNDSGEEIPPYGCMQATGTEEIGEQNYIVVNKPADTTGDAGGYLFNSHEAIPAGELGIAQRGRVVRGISDGSGITAGDAWQPVVSAWTIAVGGGQFIGIGEDDIGTNVVRVFINSGGSEEVTVLTDVLIDETAICFCRKKILAVVVEELDEVCIPLSDCPPAGA